MVKTVHGIVLYKESASEADELMTIYTKEYGKVRAKIIGVKKPLSKLRPLTTLFSKSRFQLYFRGGGRSSLKEPGKVIGGEILSFNSELRNDWKKMTEAAIWCETVNDLTRTFYPNLQEYELVVSTLEILERSPFPEPARLRSTLILLKILGYSFRHHSKWRELSEDEKKLMMILARWNITENRMDTAGIEKLKQIIHSYLALYLNRPLKSELFRQKILQAESPPHPVLNSVPADTLRSHIVIPAKAG